MARAYGPVEKLRKTKQFITMRTIIEVAIGNITIFSDRSKAVITIKYE